MLGHLPSPTKDLFLVGDETFVTFKKRIFGIFICTVVIYLVYTSIIADKNCPKTSRLSSSISLDCISQLVDL